MHDESFVPHVHLNSAQSELHFIESQKYTARLFRRYATMHNAFGIWIDIYCRHDDNKRYGTKTESTKTLIHSYAKARHTELNCVSMHFTFIYCGIERFKGIVGRQRQRLTGKKNINIDVCTVVVRILGQSPKFKHIHELELPLHSMFHTVCIRYLTQTSAHQHSQNTSSCDKWEQQTAAPLITIVYLPLSNSQTLPELWRKRHQFN